MREGEDRTRQETRLARRPSKNPLACTCECDSPHVMWTPSVGAFQAEVQTFWNGLCHFVYWRLNARCCHVSSTSSHCPGLRVGKAVLVESTVENPRGRLFRKPSRSCLIFCRPGKRNDKKNLLQRKVVISDQTNGKTQNIDRGQ